MKGILKKLHLYYFLVVLALAFILLYPLIYFFSRRPVNFKGMNSLRWAFSFISTSLSGIFYKFTYEQKVDWSKTYIICANHTSNLDITAIILLAGNNIVFMGKEELLKNFITGIYFRTIDIPVKRESKMSAFRAFKKAEESIKEGKSVVIFPEGMISEFYPPVLQPFKNGPFKLAIDQGVAILPVTIVDNWELMWDDGNKYGSKPGICDIYIHAPIETTGMQSQDAESLREMVYDLIHGRLKRHHSSMG
ncbi:lysophospholipid acyltransferase family protein [Daejeonella sp. JGW-45]|uniref:lysophospholipid acyltransferase family protein n=1 Tax=Daejeonella sp. JGW-45 TaxID=3034148 RepID=UPI0023EBB068|nr:lysophospholipid acyltransferase family protein [Daejeonella sp. JGW-45]